MTSSLNDSFVSVGEKSELDIEFELCEELLEEEINESNEVVSNYFHELPFEINSNELCSEEEDINNTNGLPSDSNVSDDGEFDSEVKKCYDVLNVGENDPDVLSLFCESDIESELKPNAEVPTENITEGDIESCFSETEISTLEEFEISILECGNTPAIKQDIDDKENYNDEEKDINDPGWVSCTPAIKQDIDDKENYNDEEKDINDPGWESGTPAIKQDIDDKENYNDEEKDINDPGWELIKKLSTNEERYKHVKECWKSSIVPDPNRNLTYHSYRKRHFRNLKVVPKTRKRAATSNLDVSMLNPAKRQRSCTFLYDQNINSLSAEKDKRERDIFDNMHCEVGHVNKIFFEQEQRLQRQYANGRHNYNAYGQMYNLREKCQSEIELIKQQYISKANQCTAELQYNIDEMSNARDEVLQFYSFYKSSNSNDPTILTTAQLQELDEIENIYSQFNKLYK